MVHPADNQHVRGKTETGKRPTARQDVTYIRSRLREHPDRGREFDALTPREEGRIVGRINITKGRQHRIGIPVVSSVEVLKCVWREHSLVGQKLVASEEWEPHRGPAIRVTESTEGRFFAMSGIRMRPTLGNRKGICPILTVPYSHLPGG